jgi:hypothetical protein
LMGDVGSLSTLGSTFTIFSNHGVGAGPGGTKETTFATTEGNWAQSREALTSTCNFLKLSLARHTRKLIYVIAF